jgi:hypothetical protein
MMIVLETYLIPIAIAGAIGLASAWWIWRSPRG